MKIKPYNRIRFRFYLFVTIVIVASVGITSWRFSNFFLVYLQHNFRKSAIDFAQIAGLNISFEIRDIERTLNNFMTAERQLNKQTLRTLFKSLQDMNGSILDFSTITVKGNNKQNILYSSDQEGRHALKIEKLSKDLKNMANYQGLRLYPGDNYFLLIKTYSIEQGDTLIYQILTINNAILDPYIGVAENQAVRVLNQELVDLHSADSRFNLEEVFASRGIRWRSILQNDMGSGFLSSFLDEQGYPWVGAYHRDPRYGFMVVILHKADSIQGSFVSVIKEIIDWVVLILLISLGLVYLLTRPILANLDLLFRTAHEIAHGRFHNLPAVRSRDEIGYLAASMRWMASQIAGLLASEKQKIIYEKELQTANTVQLTFFKNPHIYSESFNLVSFYKPASACGGDWWGHFPIKNGVDLVLIGDATGHGVPAALITAIAFTTSNILVERIRQGELDYKRPSAILIELNKVLYSCLEGQLCMTFVAMALDANQGKVYLSNGGHTFPILIPANKSDPRLSNRRKNSPSVTYLNRRQGQSTSILGIKRDTEFHDSEFDLKIGDRIVMYTDGITEATNPSDKQWGTRSLIKSLCKSENLSIKDMLDELMRNLYQFSSKQDLFDDDITVVILEYGGLIFEGIDN